MEYVVGDIAALISGDVTPNRPKLLKKALTPMKHQPSPNVTPKSECVVDRSIFLSPTLQKKKAIVKKSPKRIFQNPDLDVTNEFENSSPKADKVKKHLKENLDGEVTTKKGLENLKSPNKKHNKSMESLSVKKNRTVVVITPDSNESTLKKKKKLNSLSKSTDSISEDNENEVDEVSKNANKGPKKKKYKKFISDVTDDVKTEEKENIVENETPETLETTTVSPKKKNKNCKSKSNTNETESFQIEKYDKTKEPTTENKQNTKKKNKNRSKKSKAQKNQQVQMEVDETEDNQMTMETQNEESTLKQDNIKKSKKQDLVNPNAITNEESDSEHGSDDEIESENEEINKEIFANNMEQAEESSDEEDNQEQKKQENKTEKVQVINTEEETRRTLFVGNVPFSAKCKKEIKKIFAKYGEIDSVRIRTVPVKDARATPKLAVIKNELHPDRTTVHCYVKFSEESSVEQALVENNTVLNNYHLRVTKSNSTGVEHDPHCSVFVGNIPFGLEDEALRAKFEKCGEIDSVRIVRDRKTNAGKGFGYINFTSKDGVELALDLSEEDLTIKNRIMRLKRCTQFTQKQGQRKKETGKKFNNFPARNQGNNFPPRNQGKNFPPRNQGNNFQPRNPGNNFQPRNQGNNFPPRNQGRNFQPRNQGNNFQPRNQGNNFQPRNQGNNFQPRNQGNNFQLRNQGRNNFQGGDKFGGGNQGRNFGNRQWGSNDENRNEGAYRRIMNKRGHQNAGDDGPPNKKQKNIDRPVREKKEKKEFVGVTAEKKKKRKFDKGDKKKKAISEILTK